MIKHRTRFQILYDSCLAMIAFISFLIVAASFFSKSISLKKYDHFKSNACIFNHLCGRLFCENA